MATFGENAGRIREEKGIQKSQLAKALGVGPGQLSNWEQDRFGLPSGRTMLRFAKALGCSVDDLLAGVDAKYDAILRDLSCHAADRQQALPPEGGLTDASAAARVLEDRLARDRALAREMQDALVALGNIATTLEEGAGTTGRGKTGGPRRHRKTG